MSLVEVLIALSVVVIVLSAGLITCGSCGGCADFLVGGSKESAQEQARVFASELGIKVKGLTCANRDTDADGYVSCNLATEDDRIVPIECARKLSLNSGCRTPKMIAPVAR